MRQHIIPTVIASIIAGAVGFSTAHLEQRKTVTFVKTTGDSAPDEKLAARAQRYQWGSLTQFEVDSITNALKSIPNAAPIIVYCQDDARCGDIALDFDNAFESAHVRSEVQKPLLDTTRGIATSSKVLSEIIATATSGRIVPHVLSEKPTKQQMCDPMPDQSGKPIMSCVPKVVPEAVALVIGSKA